LSPIPESFCSSRHSGERSDSKISIEKNNADSGPASRQGGQARMTIYPTICFLASPHRLANELVDIKSVFGDIEIVVARELTKLHEEVYRGKIGDALTHFSDPKGEFVILFKI
jgi:16S rRNA C1402 (ribose-2'-O) methylase RsmI